jgi:large subunit ribosomal protein L9
MKVILKENMKNLGHQGDVVEVKNGYANNFLFPRGYALMATPGNLKMLEENNRQGAKKREKLKADALALSEQLKDFAITIGMKAGANGKIFGSVNTVQLAEALRKEGYYIDRKSLKIKDEPIKDLGTYEAEANLYKGVKQTFKFEVVSE